MAEEGIYMEIPAVQSMADKFRTLGDILTQVGKALEAALTVLKVTAFVGLVGGSAVIHYLENIKPKVEWLANKFGELNLDLQGAIVSYRDGDSSGSKRFQG